jgi:hypothetical protein
MQMNSWKEFLENVLISFLRKGNKSVQLKLRTYDKHKSLRAERN